MMDDSDRMEECPYDRSHQVKRSRMQFHMKKCRQAKGIEMRRCPYNAAHDVESYNYDSHLSECPNRDSVEVWSQKSGSGLGSVHVPCNQIVLPEVDENWDSVDHPTYDPTAKNMLKPVYRQCTGFSKSIRKMHKAEERERFQLIQVEGSNLMEVPDIAPETDAPANNAFNYDLDMRQPFAPSKTFAVPEPPRIVPGIHGMGRGRLSAAQGHPLTQPVRILPPVSGGNTGAVPKVKKSSKKKSKSKSGHDSDTSSVTTSTGVPHLEEPSFQMNPSQTGASRLVAALTLQPVEDAEQSSYEGLPSPLQGQGDWNVNGAGVGGWTTLAEHPRQRPLYQMPVPDLTHNEPGRGRGRMQQQQQQQLQQQPFSGYKQ